MGSQKFLQILNIVTHENFLKMTSKTIVEMAVVPRTEELNHMHNTSTL